MEQKINLLVIIKIAEYVFLTLICHFNKFECIAKKSSHENWHIGEKFYTKNYRLLAKYEQLKDLNNAWLKEKYQNSVANGQKHISNSDKVAKGRNQKSNRSSLNKAQYYTEVIDYNNAMFDGKHFHFEKKWMKKKDYDDLVEKNRRISNITEKKIKFRSYGFGLALFLLFFLLGIGFPILKVLGTSKILGTTDPFEQFLTYIKNYLGKIYLPEKYFYPLSFAIVIILLAVTIIISISKILINNEKYKKIKLMTD
ncbi:hypothetical protein MKS88_002198 [Plasmodium brasilianum]|uniref:Uncharacterized protein n=1 Tax=Plasmodium brasilianum TaxID=5824 RepID=A0ACB9YD75_PLABR|nr:hypothetical protein MKS88_002198 [Plasmodium brasilianum]